MPAFVGVDACLLGRVLPARFTHFLIVLGWTSYFSARTETAILLSTQSLTAAAIVSGVKFVIFCGVAGMEIRACADRSLHCQGVGLSHDIEAPWVCPASLIHHGIYLLCLPSVHCVTAASNTKTGILRGVKKTIILCKFVFAHVLFLISFFMSTFHIYVKSRHVYIVWHILKLWQGFLHIWDSFWSCDHTLRAGFDLSCSSFGGLNFPFLLPLEAFQNLS